VTQSQSQPAVIAASTITETKPCKQSDDVQSSSSFWCTALEFLIIAGLIFGIYFKYGLLHESIVHHGPDKVNGFQHDVFLTSSQCFVSMLFALVCLIGSGHYTRDDQTPLTDYIKVSMSYNFAMSSSTAALKYISYPIQALAKSCKLIPVMIGRIFFGGLLYFFLFEHATLFSMLTPALVFVFILFSY
jgi:uncharacterized membrane protein YgdD (TMEM256/DUF423 family)